MNSKVCFISLVILFLIPSLFAQMPKNNIAVLDLDPTGISTTDAQFLSDRLRTELFETGAFQVVERDKMNSILEEQGFQNSGCTSVECAVEIGQLLNVKEMVAGSIGKIEDIYSISIRLIDVSTGAIIKTATRDYRGKLSEVLTDVIPEVAAMLAKDIEKSSTEKTDKLKKKDRKTEANSNEKEAAISETEIINEPAGNRYLLFFKGGFASLKYVDDINKNIDDASRLLNNNDNFLSEKLPQHSNFGFEVRYILFESWRLKLGLTSENMLSQSKCTYNTLFWKHSFERQYTFVNIYFGVNSIIWGNPGEYNLYIGADIGSTTFNSRLKEEYIQLNSNDKFAFDNEYKYDAFTFKLAIGFEYYISSSLSLFTEFAFIALEKFDISDQKSEFEFFPTGLIPVIFPEEIDASGMQINFAIGYHF